MKDNTWFPKAMLCCIAGGVLLGSWANKDYALIFGWFLVGLGLCGLIAVVSLRIPRTWPQKLTIGWKDEADSIHSCINLLEKWCLIEKKEVQTIGKSLCEIQTLLKTSQPNSQALGNAISELDKINRILSDVCDIKVETLFELRDRLKVTSA